jgi:hypothetical protein
MKSDLSFLRHHEVWAVELEDETMPVHSAPQCRKKLYALLLHVGSKSAEFCMQIDLYVLHIGTTWLFNPHR